jgi:hypothetical protein
MESDTCLLLSMMKFPNRHNGMAEMNDTAAAVTSESEKLKSLRLPRQTTSRWSTV